MAPKIAENDRKIKLTDLNANYDFNDFMSSPSKISKTEKRLRQEDFKSYLDTLTQ